MNKKQILSYEELYEAYLIASQERYKYKEVLDKYKKEIEYEQHCNEQLRNKITNLEYKIKRLEENNKYKEIFDKIKEMFKEERAQLLMICHKDNKIVDIVRVDATENNIKLIKEIIKDNKTNLRWDEYEKGSTAKGLKEIMSIADAIMID